MQPLVVGLDLVFFLLVHRNRDGLGFGSLVRSPSLSLLPKWI